MLLLQLLTAAGRGWLKAHGVCLGRGGWVHGFPELHLAKGSRVDLGPNVSLCSLSRFNPIAPGRRLSFVTLSAQAHILIHEGAGISNSVLSCVDRIEIGAGSMIGAECLIMDSDLHGLPLGANLPTRHAPVLIGKNVFIGARSIILKGVTIGEGSVVGAGSVVSRSLPPHSLAAGNPARVLRSLAGLSRAP